MRWIPALFAVFLLGSSAPGCADDGGGTRLRINVSADETLLVALSSAGAGPGTKNGLLVELEVRVSISETGGDLWAFRRPVRDSFYDSGERLSFLGGDFRGNVVIIGIVFLDGLEVGRGSGSGNVGVVRDTGITITLSESCPVPGLSRCGTDCFHLGFDPNHCGKCGNSCGEGNTCLDGACLSGCAEGQTNCGGTCLDTQRDESNCGGCGTTCDGGLVCVGGQCTDCGNSTLEGGEQCDEDILEVSCAALGYATGTLSCFECVYDEDGCTNSQADLLGFWRFEETDGGAAADSSDAGSGLSVSGGGVDLDATGIVGSGVSFDRSAGKNQGRLVGPSSLNLSTAMTIEAWVRPVDFSGSCGAGGNAIAARWGSSPQGQFLLATCSSAQVHFSASDGATAITLTSTSALALNTWAHVAATFDAGTIRLYINGEEEKVQTAGPDELQPGFGGELVLGADTTSGTSWLFDGQIDEARLWNVARTQEQVCEDAGGILAGAAGCDLSGINP